MALIVEDGSGMATAESYLSEAAADTYHTNHGAPAAWSGATTAEREAALRTATQFLDGEYRGMWTGEKKTGAQALAWPRAGGVDDEGYAVDADSLPVALEHATAELALRAVSGALRPDQARGGSVRRERKQVGTLAVETEYMDTADDQTSYDWVELLLGGLLEGAANVVTVERA